MYFVCMWHYFVWCIISHCVYRWCFLKCCFLFPGTRIPIAAMKVIDDIDQTINDGRMSGWWLNPSGAADHKINETWKNYSLTWWKNVYRLQPLRWTLLVKDKFTQWMIEKMYLWMQKHPTNKQIINVVSLFLPTVSGLSLCMSSQVQATFYYCFEQNMFVVNNN